MKPSASMDPAKIEQLASITGCDAAKAQHLLEVSTAGHARAPNYTPTIAMVAISSVGC